MGRTFAMKGSGSIFFPAIWGAMTSSKNPTSTGWNESTPFMEKKIGRARPQGNRSVIHWKSPGTAGPTRGSGAGPRARRKQASGALGSGVLVDAAGPGGAPGRLAGEASHTGRADVDPDDRLLELVL